MTEVLSGTDYGLQFSKPRIVMTNGGERTVCDADPTEEFWAAWRSNKDAVKSAGLSVSKNPSSGKWKVARWASVIPREEREAAAAASRAANADIDIPAPEGLAYMPFQKAGIAYALPRTGTLIGDEMGLGKTIQAIGVANATAPKRILVVCPASLLLNWKREIEKWQLLGLPITVIRPGSVFNPRPDGWYLINFDIAHRYEALLRERPWDLVVIDECHRLKTASAKRTLALFGGQRTVKLPDGQKKKEQVEPVEAKKKLLMTGTPICNRPAELYPLLRYLDKDRWFSWGSYAKRYCDAFNSGFGLNAKGASNLDELQARLRETLMVRRLKKDVLKELPAKVRQIITLEPEDEVTKALIEAERLAHEANQEAIAAASYAVQKAEAEGTDAEYEIAVAKLRQVQGAAFTEMAKMRHDVAMAKLPSVVGHLEECEGQVVVFAWHKDMVAGLVKALTPLGGCVSVTGETKLEDRQKAVDDFQAGKVRWFVGNILAAGVGLTLTASSHVVAAELDWVPGNMSQAEDRCHRIGQTDSVLVQHIVLDGSLDAKLAKQLVAKQEVIDKALDAETKVDIAGADYVWVPAPPTAPGSEPSPAQKADQKRTDKQRKNDEIAATLTAGQIAAIHAALRTVAAMDADRAQAINEMGFNKMDTMFGCELAARDRLTPRQAAGAMKMIRKYRRQYSTDLYEQIFGKEDE